MIQRTYGKRVVLSERKARWLLDAMLIEFPSVLITGYLVDAQISCECVQGFVYIVGRSDNGEFITSGQIREIRQYVDYWVIETVDMDCFVLVNFHTHGGRRSLNFLVELFESAAFVGSEHCWH